MPSDVAPLKNVTVPVGAVVPSTTFAFRVTLWPEKTLVEDALKDVVDCGQWRSHLDGCHHALVFVGKNVAMVDKGSDESRVAEIHQQCNARIRA